MSNILAPDGKSPARDYLRQKSPKQSSWWSVYEAANRADFRGYFYFPTLNPALQQDTWSRQTIMERTSWLYNNVGAVTMVIDALAHDEVGTGLWPKWTTSNDAFNKAITDAFHFANHDPRIFSADSFNDFYSAQVNIRRMIRLYGDCFGQLLRPGPGSVMPSMNLIPGYRVANSGDEKEIDGWRDGVQCNALGRPLNYKVIDGDSPFIGAESPGYQVVASDDMLHFHDLFLPGQVRGMPVLDAVAKRMFSREDILRAITNGTLVRERMGYVIQKKGAAGDGPDFSPSGGEVEEIKNNDGSIYTVQKIFGDNVRDEVEIPELPDGKEMKILESQRPGTAVTDFLDSILGELAWRTKYPREYVFFLNGMGQGTVARLVLQKAKVMQNAARSFQLIPQFIHRWDVFFAWMRIRGGAFDSIPGGIPSDWWKHRIISPADMTVDLGREGNLFDHRVSENKMSISSYHGLAGEDDGDVEDENLAVINRRLKKLATLNEQNGTNFTYLDLWPRSVNQQLPQNNQSADFANGQQNQ